MAAKEFLEHHGIKGQRWGIRNKVNPKTGRVSSDHRVVSDLRARPRHSLSNKQLQTVNTRLNLEQNFARLNPSKREINQKRFKTVFTAVAGTSIAGFVKSNEGKKIIAAGAAFLSGPSIKKGIRTIGKTA